jgi:hypothetical protein
MTTTTMTEKRLRTDYRQTIALDEIAWKQIHEMADDIASSVSGTLRILIREAYARKQKQRKELSI